MLLKDIISIKPGTLIKGFKIKPFRNRSAIFNLDGWEITPEFDFECIQTIFYPLGYIPEQYKIYNSNELQVSDEKINELRQEDFWKDWDHSYFIKYNIGDPIGIHLGEYIICDGDELSNKGTNLYSKILLPSGDIGFLVFHSKNWKKKEMELV
jgi:hypothetical protein